MELGDLGGVEALARLLDDDGLGIAVEVEEFPEVLDGLVLGLGA